MSQSIDDLPTHIIIEIISNLSSYIVDYLPLKLVSSRWNFAINCYFESIKHLVQRRIKKIFFTPDCWSTHIENRCEVTKDGLVVCKTSNLLDQIISCMKLLPNLTAVSVDLYTYTKEDQDTLFTYLNTRPTITSLELVCYHRYAFYKLQNDVKLENIRNLAIDAEMIHVYSENALNRLFQADHKLTQLFVNNYSHWSMPFGSGALVKRMPTLRSLSQQLQLVHTVCDIYDETDLLTYTSLQPGLSFENLESCSFHAGLSGRGNFLNYVDNFVACCPNLKSVDCWLSYGDEDKICRLNNLRAFSNVENLAIQSSVYRDSSWEFVSQIIEMFPMVKNLKLQDIRGIGHNQISQTLLELPNLSFLYLRRLMEFPTGYHLDRDIVKVDCEALKEEYSSKYGRNLQIVKRDALLQIEEFPLRHGFNFMKNIFWSDWPPRLVTD